MKLLVERQKVIWARERGPQDPPGGAWETSAQPRLNLEALASQIDAQTVSAVEVWLHENMQGVSSRLLGVEDAAVTEMMLMCNPVRDHEIQLIIAAGTATSIRPTPRRCKPTAMTYWRMGALRTMESARSTTTAYSGSYPAAMSASTRPRRTQR